MSMWLAIDIGNTNIHIGIFEEDILRSTYSVKNEFTPSTHANLIKILNSSILSKAQAVVISSVNPRAEDFVIECIQKYLLVKPKRIGKDILIRIPVLTEYPEKVGMDRLVNALAAFEWTHNWAIVVDAGTAITIDGVDNKGAFLGGIIAPGVDICSKALHHYTALLPEVPIRKPKCILGKNTEEAINTGIYWGTIGMVGKLISMLCDDLGCQPTVIATGGNANMLAKEIHLITVVLPNLALEGIKIAYKTSLVSNKQH